MHDLTVPNLGAGISGQVSQRIYDVQRVQKPFGLDGVSVAFVDVKPTVALPIINPAQTAAVYDAPAAFRVRGNVG